MTSRSSSVRRAKSRSAPTARDVPVEPSKDPIPRLLGDALQLLVEARPADPFAFLAEHFDRVAQNRVTGCEPVPVSAHPRVGEADKPARVPALEPSPAANVEDALYLVQLAHRSRPIFDQLLFTAFVRLDPSAAATDKDNKHDALGMSKGTFVQLLKRLLHKLPAPLQARALQRIVRANQPATLDIVEFANFAAAVRMSLVLGELMQQIDWLWSIVAKEKKVDAATLDRVTAVVAKSPAPNPTPNQTFNYSEFCITLCDAFF